MDYDYLFLFVITLGLILVITPSMCFFELRKRYVQLATLQTEILKNNENLLKELAAEQAKKKEVLSIEARQILHDITSQGTALVRITPMDPADIFWRAPR